MVILLRLDHRKERDKRVTTHLFLSARILGVKGIYYSGDEDKKLEESINKVEKEWGKMLDFIKYTPNPLKTLKQLKNNHKVVHLTMYGIPYKQEINNIKNQNICVVVGSEKVEWEIYDIADYNISVGNQPHSEITALTLFMYEFNNHKIYEPKESKRKIIPLKKGKKVVMYENTGDKKRG